MTKTQKPGIAPIEPKLVRKVEEAVKSVAGLDPAKAMQVFLALAGEIDDEAGDQLVENNPELIAKYGPLATSIYQQYVFDFERSAKKQLMDQANRSASWFKAATSFFGAAAYDRAEEMFRHLDFQNANRFVVVGCGQLPFTAFHAHDHTKQTEIIALDVLEDTIAGVGQLAQRFDMKRLRAEVLAGQFFDFDSADIVYVANMVSPKSEVLKRIASTAPSTVQVVLRDPYSIGRLWSERGRDVLHPAFMEIGHGAGANYKSQDVYLQRSP